MTTAQKNIKFEKSANWIVWLFFVRIRAQVNNIWNFVNLDVKMRPLHLIRSVESMYEETLKIDQFDVNDFELYKTKTIIYKTQLTKYNIQHEIFKRLIIYIQIIIFITAVVFIQKVKTHSWNLLRALKKRFVSFNEYRRLKIEIKYWDLCRGPNNQNIDKWLNSWQLIYFESKKLHVAEMQNNRSIKNFIFSLIKKNEAWTNAHVRLINEKKKNNKLYEIIKEFRIYNRLKLNLKLQFYSHETFSTNSHQSKNLSLVDIKFDLKKNHNSYKKQKSSLSCVCERRCGRATSPKSWGGEFQNRNNLSPAVLREFICFSPFVLIYRLMTNEHFSS